MLIQIPPFNLPPKSAHPCLPPPPDAPSLCARRGVADLRVRFVAGACKWLSTTSPMISLSISAACLRSSALCASECVPFLSRHMLFEASSVIQCELFVQQFWRVSGSGLSEKSVELAFYEAAERHVGKYVCRVICRCVRGDVALDGSAPSCNDHFFSTRVLNI